MARRAICEGGGMDAEQQALSPPRLSRAGLVATVLLVSCGRVDAPTTSDAASDDVVDRDAGSGELFGGDGENGVLADLWGWDGATWIEIETDDGPPARSRHAMAYDSARDRIVLFGGNQGEYANQWGDTWELTLD
jgi:hypothetical protein